MGIDYSALYWDTVKCGDAALDQLVAALAASADNRIASIGPVFRNFRDSLIETGCINKHDKTIQAVSVFNAHASVDGFKNENLFGPRAFPDNDKKGNQLIRSRVHEGEHALQFNRVACLHADPFNPHTRVFLTPDDHVLLMELKERPAFAIEELIDGVLAGRIDPQDIQSMQDWVQDRVRHNLESVFVDGCSRLDYYRDLALTEYERLIFTRMEEYNGDVLFATLEDEDITAIGRVFPGLDMFGNRPGTIAHLRKKDMNVDQVARCSDIASRLSLAKRTVYPFGVALANRGCSRESFLKQGLTRPLGLQRTLDF